MAEQNFRMLRPSRKPLKAGDVFAMQLPDELYLFGRVVSTDARWSISERHGTTNLVYVFNHRSPEMAVPDRTHLQTDNLLVPPSLINRLGWSRGYFQTLANLPFGPGEALPVHCFYFSFQRRWFDEHGSQLARPVGPVGSFAAGNYRTLEDEVCDALGISRAPDD